MEGRTIARPDGEAFDRFAVGACTFNGGPDNCPARPANMRLCAPVRASFNGGPDNCPARPVTAPTVFQPICALQWRAGQLPGQTAHAGATVIVNTPLQWRAGQLPGQTLDTRHKPEARRPPSMEGRTIARPDSPVSAGPSTPTSSFNGGPDNCPARPDNPNASATTPLVLQWRAGQLPGQTLVLDDCA